MISVNNYRQFMAELVAAAQERSGVRVEKVRLAFDERQLVNLLRDQAGIVVAGNIPGASITNNGFFLSEGQCLVLVLEKMPDDWLGSEHEYTEYGRMQTLMGAIVRLLTGEDFQEFCDQGEPDFSQGFNVEWEFNSYGGFCGLSLVYHLNTAL